MNELATAESSSAADPVRSAANIEMLKSRVHDLANLIAAIQSGSEMLDDSPSPETIGSIRAAVLEARTELQSIGTHLHGSGGRAEYFDVREQMDQLLELLRRSIPAKVTVEVNWRGDSALANAPLHDFQVAAAEALLLALESHPGGTLPVNISRKPELVFVEFGSTADPPKITLPAP